MAGSSVACPDCGTEVRVGIPRHSTVLAVTEDDEPLEGTAVGADLDDEAEVVGRENACEEGHHFVVHFLR